jgi:hypothetical protein
MCGENKIGSNKLQKKMFQVVDSIQFNDSLDARVVLYVG